MYTPKWLAIGFLRFSIWFHSKLYRWAKAQAGRSNLNVNWARVELKKWREL